MVPFVVLGGATGQPQTGLITSYKLPEFLNMPPSMK